MARQLRGARCDGGSLRWLATGAVLTFCLLWTLKGPAVAADSLLLAAASPSQARAAAAAATQLPSRELEEARAELLRLRAERDQFWTRVGVAADSFLPSAGATKVGVAAWPSQARWQEHDRSEGDASAKASRLQAERDEQAERIKRLQGAASAEAARLQGRIEEARDARKSVELLARTEVANVQAQRDEQAKQLLRQEAEARAKAAGLEAERDALAQKVALLEGRLASGAAPVSKAPSPKEEKGPVPIFIHIPKNAGSSIEEGLHEIGVNQGHFFPGGIDDMPYKTIRKIGCTKQHMVPSNFIKNGYIVARDPMERLMSHFCWAMDLGHLGPYYRQRWVPELWPRTCSMLNEWLAMALLLFENRNGIEDCHLVPQYSYGRNVQHIFKMNSSLEDNIRALHPALDKFRMPRVNVHRAGGDVDQCSRFNITARCLEEAPQNLRRLLWLFRADYVNLGPFLTTSLEVGWRGLGDGCCQMKGVRKLYAGDEASLSACKQRCMGFLQCGYVTYEGQSEGWCEVFPATAGCGEHTEECKASERSDPPRCYGYGQGRCWKAGDRVTPATCQRQACVTTVLGRSDRGLQLASGLWHKDDDLLPPPEDPPVLMVPEWTSSGGAKGLQEPLEVAPGPDEEEFWFAADFGKVAPLFSYLSFAIEGPMGSLTRTARLLMFDRMGREQEVWKVAGSNPQHNISVELDMHSDFDGLRTHRLKWVFPKGSFGLTHGGRVQGSAAPAGPRLWIRAVVKPVADFLSDVEPVFAADPVW